jgi:hypothetical protein
MDGRLCPARYGESGTPIRSVMLERLDPMSDMTRL